MHLGALCTCLCGLRETWSMLCFCSRISQSRNLSYGVVGEKSLSTGTSNLTWRDLEGLPERRVKGVVGAGGAYGPEP